LTNKANRRSGSEEEAKKQQRASTGKSLKRFPNLVDFNNFRQKTVLLIDFGYLSVPKFELQKIQQA